MGELFYVRLMSAVLLSAHQDCLLQQPGKCKCDTVLHCRFNNTGGCGNVGCNNVGTSNVGSNNEGSNNKGDNNNGSNNVGYCLSGSNTSGDEC